VTDAERIDAIGKAMGYLNAHFVLMCAAKDEHERKRAETAMWAHATNLREALGDGLPR
jgi:hypothetical protein